MLWTMALLFLVLWGVGTVTSYTMGGFVHLLLVLALATVLLQLVQSRRDRSWPLEESAREPK
ncbi:MAG: lmo0937 family membrane protein [Deltaproteobacteria bacterium]|nr:lmo0937 family membrane protein [Deltaproteobacteria bacterium]